MTEEWEGRRGCVVSVIARATVRLNWVLCIWCSYTFNNASKARLNRHLR